MKLSSRDRMWTVRVADMAQRPPMPELTIWPGCHALLRNAQPGAYHEIGSRACRWSHSPRNSHALEAALRAPGAVRRDRGARPCRRRLSSTTQRKQRMAGVDILASAFSGANAAFLGEQYARWAADLRSVDPTFAELFGALNEDARAVLEEATGASWAPRHPDSRTRCAPPSPGRRRRAPAPLSGEQIRAATIASLRALMLIRSYRVRGHLEARLDPLGLQIPRPHAELDPRSYGFTDNDLDKPIFIDNVLGRETATLREIHDHPARDLLRLDRRRVHAHPGSRPEIVDPAQGGRRALAHRVRRRGEAHHPDAAHRGGRLRGVLPEALRHHQALRPGGRRGHHPRAARDDRDGGRARRRRRSPSACRIAAG